MIGKILLILLKTIIAFVMMVILVFIVYAALLSLEHEHEKRQEIENE